MVSVREPSGAVQPVVRAALLAPAPRHGDCMEKRKTAEEKADEEGRHALARSVTNDEEFEQFFTDPNQAIRHVAAMNPDASGAVLDRFATDRFWSVKVAVAEHPNTAQGTLLPLLETDPGRGGVIHHAARGRLEAEGVEFGDDGLTVDV